MQEDKIKALQELLKLLADHPDLTERITFTIRPGKLAQSDQTHGKQ